MSERLNFLSNFITEEIFVIKESPTATDETIELDEPTIEKSKPAPTETVNEVAESPEAYLKSLPTEGENLKHCLVFFESADSQLDTAKKAFLFKVIGSVKRTLNDILLVNVNDASPEQIDAALNEFNHRHLLVFNSKKLDKYVDTPLYEVKEDGKKFYMKADDLTLIEETVDLKKALWAGLQKMFL